MESLGINAKLLIAQIINFSLFFIIFRKFIAKPFSQFLDMEVKKEREKETMLEEIKKKEERIAALEATSREKVKKQYDEAMKEVRDEVQKMKLSLIEEAKKSSDEIVTRGKTQVQEEREMLYKEIKRKIADVSVALVAKGLNQFLTKDAQKDITQYILKNFPKEVN